MLPPSALFTVDSFPLAEVFMYILSCVETSITKLLFFRTAVSHRSGPILVKHWQSSGFPYLLLGHANGRGPKGAVMHLGIIAHLDSEC